MHMTDISRIVKYLNRKDDLNMSNVIETENTSTKRDCHCHDRPRPCYACEYNDVVQNRPIQLASDCIVVDSLVCTKKIYPVAELVIPVPTLGDIIDIGPGGLISPLITLIPDINGLTYQTTVTKDLIVVTGFLPANISILGIDTPLQINLPFQEEIVCPGVCPEDTVRETNFMIRSVVTQGIEALGITVANILFKVILTSQVTVTRPIITKSDDLRIVGDVNVDRCETNGRYG